MTSVVAYDLGRTNCRATLVVDGERVDVVTEPTEATVIDREGRQAVADVVRRVTQRLDPPPVRGAALGLTGLQQASEIADELGEALTALHPGARAVVASDVTIAHAGALGGRPGVVVLAGTGAASLGVGPAGERVHVDGWGYLLGDAGSGFHVGRSGLAAALGHRDGRGPPTTLVGLAEDRFGPLEDVPALVHGAANPARVVASFADAVARAARTGDAVAEAIWSQAAQDLARTAAAAVERLDALTSWSDTTPSPVPVSWAGGLLSNRDLLLDPLRAELQRLTPAAQLIPPEGDALHGAALLAHDEHTCHEPALHIGAAENRPPRDEDRPGRRVASQMGER